MAQAAAKEAAAPKEAAKDGAPETAVAKKEERALAHVPIVDGQLQPTDVEGLYRVATMMWRAGMKPKSYLNIESLMVGMQLGRALGFGILQGPQHIAVINGIGRIYGDGALAVVRKSGQLEKFKEERIFGKGERAEGGEAEEVIGWKCTAKRKGVDEIVWHKFDETDAKRAKLFGKEGPWQGFASRMCMFRARAFTLRDLFGDILLGLPFVEEVIETEAHVLDGQAADEARPMTKAEELGVRLGVDAGPAPAEPPAELAHPVRCDHCRGVVDIGGMTPVEAHAAMDAHRTSTACGSSASATEPEAPDRERKMTLRDLFGEGLRGDPMAEALIETERRMVDDRAAAESEPTPPAPEPSITPAQLEALIVARKAASCSAEGWQLLLSGVGATDTSVLTEAQAARLIAELEAPAEAAPEDAETDRNERQERFFDDHGAAEAAAEELEADAADRPFGDNEYMEVPLAGGVVFVTDGNLRSVRYVDADGKPRFREPTADEEAAGLRLGDAGGGRMVKPLAAPAATPAEPPAPAEPETREQVKAEVVKLRDDLGAEIFAKVCDDREINAKSWDRLRLRRMRVLRAALRERLPAAE